LTDLLKHREGEPDYIDDFFNGRFHVTQLITCPYRSLYPKETYSLTLGRIFDLGVKQFYKEKGYEVNVPIEFVVTDKIRIVGEIDLLRKTGTDVEIIEVKLTDFNEYTVTKGLMQVYMYGRIYKSLHGVQPDTQLWCFSLRSFRVFKPSFNDKLFNKVIERAIYCYTYVNKYGHEPRIPSRLDCGICEEKFNCRLAYKKVEDLELP